MTVTAQSIERFCDNAETMMAQRQAIENAQAIAIMELNRDIIILRNDMADAMGMIRDLRIEMNALKQYASMPPRDGRRA